MHFIIQYSICSLIVFVVVIGYNLRVRNFSTFKNNIFLIYSFAGLFVNVFDLVRCILSFSSTVYNPVTIYLTNCVYYSTVSLLPCLFTIYCLANVDYFHSKKQKSKMMVKLSLLIPSILTVLYVWITPVFNNTYFSVFYIISDTNLIMNGSFGYLFLYIQGLWFILSGIHVIVGFRRELERIVIFHMLVAVTIMVGSLISQRFFPYVRIISLAVSMSTLEFSFYVQRPEDIYDSSTRVLNKNGFKVLLNHRFSTNSRFHIYAIVMDDAAFYRSVLGKKEKRNLESCILTSLKGNFKGYNSAVFKLAYGRYAVVLQDRKNHSIENVMKFIQDQSEIRWGFSSLDLDLSFRVCVIESFVDVGSYSEVADLIDFFATSKKFKGQFLQANCMDLFRVHSHSYLDNAIYNGLKQNRFEVYYQPIYSCKDQKLTGAEALIRLRDDDGNFVSPEEFIPVAEQNGTIFEIGKFVFTSVCETLSKLNLNDYSIQKIDINLSVIQCIQEDLYKQLITIRNRYKIPSNLINIEITETATTNSPEVLLKNMKLLEADGIELSMDDYGSGNSNVNYLLTLPFKMIKIDKGIVWQAFEDPRAKLVLKSTIDMMDSLNLTVLAEGVETEEQSKVLQELGCDYLQGYFFSRPVPVDKFLEIMKK